ncbi:MAG: serine O-acetyltransferase [Pseudomonadota bacterium]
MFKTLRAEIDATMARDPAARSALEVILCYPGFQALLFYRLSRWFWMRNIKLFARWISQLGRFLTGIEIHPGARIGCRFFIDHGMGVVIGETAEIGDDVTLYHGVTLGGVAPSVDSDSQRNQKRHPSLENGVIVGSGAQILGPITVGQDARVGANAVVTKAVPARTTVVGIPAKSIQPSAMAGSEDFMAYGTPTGEIPDPIARALDGLLDEVQNLRARVGELENGGEGAAQDSLSQAGDTDQGTEAEKKGENLSGKC